MLLESPRIVPVEEGRNQTTCDSKSCTDLLRDSLRTLQSTVRLLLLLPCLPSLSRRRHERRFRKWQTALPYACWFFLIRVVLPHKASDATPSLRLLSQASSLLRVAPPLCSGWISPRYFCSRGAHLNVSRFGCCIRTSALANRCRRTTGSQVPCMRPNQDHATSIPDTVSSAIQDFFQTCPGNADSARFRCHISLFDRSSVVHFRSSSLIHTNREVPRAFP